MYSLFSPTFWKHVLNSLKPAPKFSFDPSDPTIIIPVVLTHHGSNTEALFALDTGASITVIDSSLAKVLNIKLSGRKIKVTTASGTATTQTATIDSISALGKTTNQAPILLTPGLANSGLDGLLGLSFLKHYKLEINFAKKYLKLK